MYVLQLASRALCRPLVEPADDISINADGDDVYAAVKAAGKYRYS